MEFDSIQQRCLPLEAPLPKYNWESIDLPFYEIRYKYHSAKIIITRRDGRLVPSIFEGIAFPESLRRYFTVNNNGVMPNDKLEDGRIVQVLTTRELVEAVKSSPNHVRTYRENGLRLAILASKPPRRMPKKLNMKMLGRIKHWTRRGLSKSEIAKKLSLSRPTLYKAYELIREIDAQRLMDAYKKSHDVGYTDILIQTISEKAWKYALSVCSRKDPLYDLYGCNYVNRSMDALSSPIFRSIFYPKQRELQLKVKTNMRGFNL
jgi:hypothetical protein